MRVRIIAPRCLAFFKISRARVQACHGDVAYTCAAEEGVPEVGQAERGYGTDDDTHKPADARDDPSVTQSHVTELEWV